MTALLDPACWAERLAIAADGRCVFDQLAAIVPFTDADGAASTRGAELALVGDLVAVRVSPPPAPIR